MGQVGRFGVALVATAAAILGSVQAAYAQEPPPPAPAETASTEPAPAPEPPPATTTTTSTTASDPPPSGTAETPDPAPETDATAAAESETTSDASAPAATDPAPKTEAEPKPGSAADLKDVVKLEPAQPVPAAAAPASSTPATTSSPPPAEQALPSPATVSIVLVLSPPATDTAKAAPSPAAGAEDADADADGAAAAIVSFRPRPAVALLPDDELDVAARVVRAQVVAAAQKVRRVVRQACAQPAARVPLSLRCKQQAVLAVAVARAVRIHSPSPEVRAAIDRAAAGMTARPVAARPPPESKAAKKKAHPIAEVRPTIPFGSSGMGASNDGFSSSGGASWSSRVFALAAVPLRVPRPSRLARTQLPRTIAHGVIAAPPPARPG